MALTPLDLPPGFLKGDSAHAATGRWIDGDHVRFVNKRPEKWAGWEPFIAGALLGFARASMAWTNQYGNTNAEVGTNLKLYAITGDDTVSDITPIRSTGTLASNPFATTSGSTTVVVTHTAHGADNNDFVTFAGATAVGGITIVGEYQIILVVDNDTYQITHTSAATSTSAGGGGASVTYAYQINTGNGSAVVGLGWGAGQWGEGTWSTPRTEGIALDLRHWSLSEYGNDLLAAPSGARLYLWQEATDDRAELVSGSPAAMRAMFVTGERFVFALGTTTPMTVQWPDVDDLTDWTPTAANTANSRTLQSGSKLMAGTALSDGVSLVWSDTSPYLFQYTGSEFIYDSRLIGTNCGLAGPAAFTRVGGVAYWISGQDFHMYAGGVSGIPRSEEVSRYVFDDMDPSQIAKTWCMYDQKNGQVRWGYVSLASAVGEPDSYVDVSLDGQYNWTTGTLARTTGTVYRPAVASSLMVDASGYVWEHDVGVDADGAALEAYISWGLSAIDGGARNMDIFGIVPDCQRQTGNLDFEIYTKDRPNSAANFDSGTASLGATDEIADIRLSGRHAGGTIRSNVVGGDFRLGLVQLEVQDAGERR